MATKRKRDYSWLKDAAKLGGKARWDGVSAKERSVYARTVGWPRFNESRTTQERSDAARKAVQARWARYYAAHPEKRTGTPPTERSEAARAAVMARWAKRKDGRQRARPGKSRATLPDRPRS